MKEIFYFKPIRSGQVKVQAGARTGEQGALSRAGPGQGGGFFFVLEVSADVHHPERNYLAELKLPVT